MLRLQAAESSKVISPQRPHITVFHSLTSHKNLPILINKYNAKLWM